MYTANVIRTLSARDDVELSVVAIGAPEAKRDAPPGASWILSPNRRGHGTVRGLIGKYPRVVAATISRDYRRQLRALLTQQRWDAVVIDYIAIGWVLGDVMKLTSGTSASVVYLSHNVEATLRRRIAAGYTGPAPLRWAAQRDAKKAWVLEEALVRAATFVSAETMEDASEFRSLFGAKDIHIYTPGYDGHVAEARSVPFSETRRTVAIIGSRIATMKRLVLDDLLASIAGPLHSLDVGILVAGDAPPDYLDSVVQRYPDVDFKGYVADLAPLLATVRLGIITDHIGGGFKHRTLTLVFNRVPIVATRAAMAGLPLDPGVHYIEVSGNEEIPAVVRGVIDDVQKLESTQRAAFEACSREFDWDVTTAGFIAALSGTPVERR